MYFFQLYVFPVDLDVLVELVGVEAIRFKFGLGF